MLVKSITISLLIIFSALIVCPTVWSATYYVSSSSGSDSNPGTQNSPWKTIAKVNSINFQPGDSILFKRGDIWSEQLTVPSSGTAGNPITFSAYGTGERPLIDGTGKLAGIEIRKHYITIKNFKVQYARHGILYCTVVSLFNK